MSIDARVAAVTVIAPAHCDACSGTGKDPETNWDDCPRCHGATRENPVVRLKLESRDPGGVAGQHTLTITNPPTIDPDYWAVVIGTEIWGGCDSIMIGEQKWAKRIGYTRIELIYPLADDEGV